MIHTSLLYRDLQKLTVSELHDIAKNESISEYTALKKQNLIFRILKERIRQDGLLYGEGVLEVALEPVMVADALMHLVEGQVRFAQAIKDAGVDVAFFESAACPPMLSPELFRRIELPALKQVMARIGQIVDHPVPCIIGGNTEQSDHSYPDCSRKFKIQDKKENDPSRKCHWDACCNNKEHRKIFKRHIKQDQNYE